MSRLEYIKACVEEHNKTAYVDQAGYESNARGYSKSSVKDERILPIKENRLELHEPFELIDDDRVRLMVERDYEQLKLYLHKEKQERIKKQKELDALRPTSTMRLSPNMIKKLMDEKRLYLEKGGDRYILLPEPVDLDLTDR